MHRARNVIFGSRIALFKIKKPSGNSPAEAEACLVQKENDGAVLDCKVIIKIHKSHSVIIPVVNRKYRFSFRAGLEKTTSNPTNTLPDIPVRVMNCKAFIILFLVLKCCFQRPAHVSL